MQHQCKSGIFFFSGKIDLDELIKAFSDLGIPLERGEATNLLQR